MGIVFLNGAFIPQEEAKVSAFDRGFLFSDGVYEVIPAYHSKLLGLDEHLARLNENLDYIQITPPLSVKEWKATLGTLLTENNAHDSDQSIYIQVTRGAQATREHGIPDTFEPTVFAFCSPHVFRDIETAREGFSAITLEDPRHTNCHIKATSLLPNVLAYQKAREAEAFEAILIRNGHAVEATSSNIFIAKDNIIITPPLSPNILGGVTRELVLNLLEANSIPYREASITEQELKDADEIWVTGSKKEICPIVRLNGQAVGTGQAGPLWDTVIKLYQQKKEATPALRTDHG